MPEPAPSVSAHALFQQPWPEGDYRFFQLGFLVDDLTETAKRWVGTFGIGPFHVLPRVESPCLYRGVESKIDQQVAVAQAGPVQIELIQQFCDRPSVYRDLYGPGESGFHQICTVTPDYDARKAHLEARGYAFAGELRVGRQRIGYFDTFADFGFVTEVAEAVPGFLEQLAEIAATAARWDGTDPIRLLTRDGYRVP